tara:strand:+ start:34261 stop:34575 length:315 start_codon:yes stop_codon:yes gene_type:complete
VALFRGTGGSGTSTAFGLLDEVTQQALIAQNASTLATQAINSFDSFDDRYLGSKTSDPSVDNDGNTLLVGALYFNSNENELKIYTGSTWIATLNSASVITGGGF